MVRRQTGAPRQPASFESILQGVNDWLGLPFWLDFPQRVIGWQRGLKKKLGYPATGDVVILSSLIQDLKDTTERELSQPLKHVAITTPYMPALTPEDLNDALEYAGLEPWKGLDYPRRIVEADAAYAANGYGLCNNPRDPYDCQDDFNTKPPWDLDDEFKGAAGPEVLFISFTRHLLYTCLIYPLDRAAFTGSSDDFRRLDFDAGLDSLTSSSSWGSVRSQILALPRATPYPTTHVLVTGESALHSRFRDVLAEALAELNIPSRLLHLDVHSTIAARGAAIYARRRQEVQEECTELDKCDLERERQRENRGRQSDRVRNELR